MKVLGDRTKGANLEAGDAVQKGSAGCQHEVSRLEDQVKKNISLKI